ncbi:MAG: sodium/solute symporter [Acidobacteria bacterium]|nr:sodium/solute symporter [Acidobacteriota bacterium]
MIDLVIIAAYLTGVIAAGIWFSKRQKSTARYFLAGRNLPWWAISASIVATETSTISFISVPGIAYAYGGDFRFLQLVLGYLIGRIVISILFIPSYFREELVTVYQLLQSVFGGGVRALSSAIFVVMRIIADGVRLLLTALVIAAVFTALAPDQASHLVIPASIIGLGLIMIVFTFLGGIEAVVWIEVVQLGIYIAGAIAAAVVLTGLIPGGAAAAIDLAAAAGKLRFFDFAFDISTTFGFWAGLIGGCFLTMSTHGTDQFMVQRYLSSRSERDAMLGLLSSGVLVFVQFLGFLFIGILLFAFYRPDRIPDWATNVAAPFDAPDQVFAHFIANHLPAGLMGLVVAAILAAALSSSLSSIASTATADLYAPAVKGRDDRHYLNASRLFTVGAGIAQIIVALILMGETRSALNIALSVASLLNGPILGIFLLAAMGVRGPRAALAGMIAGLAAVTWVWLGTSAAWPWYVTVGSLVTVAVGWIVSKESSAQVR